MASATATAAAQETAFPAYVPPYVTRWFNKEITNGRGKARTIEPGLSWSVNSFLLMTPLNGNPLARPYNEKSNHHLFNRGSVDNVPWR